VIKSSDSECATKLYLKARRAAGASPGESEAARAVGLRESRGDIIYQYLVPSYTVMFVFFIVTFMARNLIAERDSGTLNRLFIAPITRPGLMVGKTLPFLLISVVQTIILFLAGKALFHMSWGRISVDAGAGDGLDVACRHRSGASGRHRRPPPIPRFPPMQTCWC